MEKMEEMTFEEAMKKLESVFGSFKSLNSLNPLVTSNFTPKAFNSSCANANS